MNDKKLEVHSTRDGECRFIVSGTPTDILALWAALTDHVVALTDTPLCEAVKATESYDKEVWPDRVRRSRWRPYGRIVYDQYQCERCGKVIQTDGVSFPIECPACRSIMDTNHRKEDSI